MVFRLIIAIIALRLGFLVIGRFRGRVKDNVSNICFDR